MEPSPLRLHLGCGPSKLEGYTNVDINPLVDPDMEVDLNDFPWPWEDDEVDEIFTSDCLEHLFPIGKEEGQLNIIEIMRELHRVLKPGGLLTVSVPTTEGRGAFQDPTHVTYWNRNTFLYFVPETVQYGTLHVGFGFELLGLEDKLDKEFGVTWCLARLKKPSQ